MYQAEVLDQMVFPVESPFLKTPLLAGRIVVRFDMSVVW